MIIFAFDRIENIVEKKRFFENMVEKEENTINQHFLLFPYNIFYHLKDKCNVLCTLYLSTNAFDLDISPFPTEFSTSSENFFLFISNLKL